MVRHVEGREPGVGVGGHGVGSGRGIERIATALLVGDLPEAGNEPGDFELGREEGPWWIGAPGRHLPWGHPL